MVAFQHVCHESRGQSSSSTRVGHIALTVSHIDKLPRLGLLEACFRIDPTYLAARLDQSRAASWLRANTVPLCSGGAQGGKCDNKKSRGEFPARPGRSNEWSGVGIFQPERAPRVGVLAFLHLWCRSNTVHLIPGCLKINLSQPLLLFQLCFVLLRHPDWSRAPENYSRADPSRLLCSSLPSKHSQHFFFF